MKETIDKDATFCIIIEHKNFDSDFSTDISVDGFRGVKNEILDCLKNKLPFEFVDDNMNTVIVPYKLLKKSNVKLVWNENS
jgi:hypothetical protein